MARTQHTITVSELPAVVLDPGRGLISLVGEHGGLSLITGDIEHSNLMRGTLAIETEHGVVHLEPDQEVRISEEDGRDLDARLDASLYTVNDILTELLGSRFGWYATDDERYQGLNDTALTTSAAIDDLLARFPAPTRVTTPA